MVWARYGLILAHCIILNTRGWLHHNEIVKLGSGASMRSMASSRAYTIQEEKGERSDYQHAPSSALLYLSFQSSYKYFSKITAKT